MTHTTDPVTTRIAADPTDATLTRVADRWVLTMSRHLQQPADRVWPMLVEPTQLARWSPIIPSRALDAPGPASARETPADDEVDVEVLVADAPRELIHRWGPHLLRWRLEAEADGTLLVLEHTFDERADASSYGGGWHLCFAVLRTALEGHDVERIVGATAAEHGWQRLRDEYEAQLA